MEGPVGIGHGDAQSSAAVPPPLSRVATLSRSDIGGQRLLLHVDLCQRNEEVRLKEGNRPDGVGTGGASAADGRHKGGGGEEGRGPAERTQALEPMVIVDDSSDGGRGGGAESHAMLFPEAVQLVAEEVRSMLSAKPSAVAIVSETASGPVSAHNTILHTGPTPHPSLGLLGGSWVSTSDVISPTPVEALTNDIAPATSSPSALRATSLAVSTLLGMDVEFYDSIPEMATALGECDMSGSDPHPLAVRVMMVEGLGCPGVVPAPPVEEPELSDCEDERLPDFTWGGQGVCMVRTCVCVCPTSLRERHLKHVLTCS